jgi:hypothetical protein
MSGLIFWSNESSYFQLERGPFSFGYSPSWNRSSCLDTSFCCLPAHGPGIVTVNFAV